jgi:hypothetical protein
MMPRFFASAINSFTGLIVPSVLLTWRCEDLGAIRKRLIIPGLTRNRGNLKLTIPLTGITFSTRHAAHRPVARDDVRVVLHAADEDFIALLQQHLPKAVATRFRLAVVPAVKITSCACLALMCARIGLTCGFLRLRGQRAQRMHAAMHVGIDRRVVSAFGLDDTARLLARCGVVEVHQRLAMHQLLQDRELRTDLVDVKGWFD